MPLGNTGLGLFFSCASFCISVACKVSRGVPTTIIIRKDLKKVEGKESQPVCSFLSILELGPSLGVEEVQARHRCDSAGRPYLWWNHFFFLILSSPLCWELLTQSAQIKEEVQCCRQNTVARAMVGFPGVSVVKNLPPMQEPRVLSLSQEDPLEVGMAIHSGTLV